MTTSPTVVLASASAARAHLLEAAGIPFVRQAAGVDEDEIKVALRAEGADAGHAAETLAEVKAQRVAPRFPDALVIGADQVLECDGAWFDKPADRAQARAQLRALRGRTHRLASCATVVRGGTLVWHHTAWAELTMRRFTDAFLDDYLNAVGDAVLHSVGAYQVEGLGIQLFSRIEGDWFTILGLPLLPLLDFLRAHGVIAE